MEKRTTRTTIRSWPALILAGTILAGTCFVLFQDVLHGAPISTGHVLTALALLIATAAGHQIVPTARAGRWPLAASLAILAFASILYIGLMSGARNAEYTSAKSERIEAANASRVEILEERKAAQAMLDAARAAIARECASGEGSKCRGRRATEAVYAAAIAGHDARLAALGAPQTANAGYRAIAEGIVLLPWFSHLAVPEVVHALIVLLPWLAVLLAELSAPTFLSLALGHAEVAPASHGPSGPPRGPGRKVRKERLPTLASPQPLANVVAFPAGKRSDVLSALAAGGSEMSVSELATVMGCTVSAASRRIRAAGSAVTLRREGKYCFVSLTASVRRASA